MAHTWYQGDAEWCAHVKHGELHKYLQPCEYGCVKCFLCSQDGVPASDTGHFIGRRHQSRLRGAFGLPASSIWAPPHLHHPATRREETPPPPHGAPPRQDELAPPPPMQSATPPGVAPVTMADRLEKLEQELQRMNERQVAAATLPPPAHSPPASPTPPGLFTQKHSTSSASDADWIRPQSEHKDLLERVSEMEVKIEALDQALVRTQGLASRAAEMEVKLEALELKILQLENDPSATEEANVVLVEKPGHDFHQGLVPAEPCFAFR